MIEKKKICSFFVSEYHLLTILLPYINEKMSENKSVELILEKDMVEKVKQYLKKIKEFENLKLLKLGWKKTKREDVSSRIAENVIVIGNEKYINEVNEILDKKGNIEEIINCYNIETLTNLNEIVMKHDFVLKTSGKSEISKCSHNEQKRKTIQTQI